MKLSQITGRIRWYFTHLSFFGIEVDEIESIPAGMVAWDLSENKWTVWQVKDGRESIIRQEDITWQWLDQLESDSRRSVGEFTVSGPSQWLCSGYSDYREFWMFASAYVGLDKGGFQDQIYLVDYDSSWPEQFKEIADWLQSKLGSDVALHIEHYGSTAIPGMPAKPIIDILVEIPSFEEGKKRALPCLNSEMCEYWWYSGHMVLIKRKELMGERAYHIHMAPRGHGIWKGLVFRDYLRSHPEEAKRYALLKYRLAKSHRNDRERYTQAKTEFVHEIVAKALLDF
ncbi:MAG: GrpB family protein [Clostridia bacterium]|nr:GrpB family protein [Clostridia bacterium]